MTLDPDVDRLLKKAVRERDLSFIQAINDAIRAGLKGEGKSRRPFKQRTFALGEASFNVTKALALASDLEDVEIMKRLALNR